MMTSDELAELPCEASGVKGALFRADEIEQYLEILDGWSVIEGHHLAKSYTFPDFVTALAFTNAIGGLAESVCHHPNIELTWGRVSLQIWSHDIDGLQLADFILAARVDRIPRS